MKDNMLFIVESVVGGKRSGIFDILYCVETGKPDPNDYAIEKLGALSAEQLTNSGLMFHIISESEVKVIVD